MCYKIPLEKNNILYIHMYNGPLISVPLFVNQIMLLTKYWTKFSLAALCVSVVMFFICTRITHNKRLFEREPYEYNFIGTMIM